MRNLKKFLALVLAMMMVFSLMLTVNAADPATPMVFGDKNEVSSTYQEAVNVLSALGILKGDDNGNFHPTDYISRAEVATMIYRIATKVDEKQKDIYKDYNEFDDVHESEWFAGYVNFVANAEYVKGRTATIFDPYANVNGYEVLAMILRLVGYDKNGEFTGANWRIQTAATARSIGILKNVNEGTLGLPATREVVAEILFQALQVPTVTYTMLENYKPKVLVEDNADNRAAYKLAIEDSIRKVELPICSNLLYQNWGIVGKSPNLTFDDFGRPSVMWVKDLDDDNTVGEKNGDTYTGDAKKYIPNADPETGSKVALEITLTPKAKYDNAVTECQVAKDINNDESLDWKNIAEVLNGNAEATLNNISNLGVTQTMDYGQYTDPLFVNHKDGQEFDALHTSDKWIGATGRTTEIYNVKDYKVYDKAADPAGGNKQQYIIVYVDTFLAEVKSITEAVKDPNDHVIKAATATVKIGTGELEVTIDTASKFKVGDLVLVQSANYGADNTNTAVNDINKVADGEKVALTPTDVHVMGTCDPIDADNGHAEHTHLFPVDGDNCVLEGKATTVRVTITGTKGPRNDKNGIEVAGRTEPYYASNTFLANKGIDTDDDGALDIPSAASVLPDWYGVDVKERGISNSMMGRTYDIVLDQHGYIVGMKEVLTIESNVGVITGYDQYRVGTGKYLSAVEAYMADGTTKTFNVVDMGDDNAVLIGTEDPAFDTDKFAFFKSGKEADDAWNVTSGLYGGPAENSDKEGKLGIGSLVMFKQCTVEGVSAWYFADASDREAAAKLADKDGAEVTDNNMVGSALAKDASFKTGDALAIGTDLELDDNTDPIQTMIDHQLDDKSIIFVAEPQYAYNTGKDNEGSNSLKYAVYEGFRTVPTITADNNKDNIASNILFQQLVNHPEYVLVYPQQVNREYIIKNQETITVDDSYLVLSRGTTYPAYSEYNVLKNGKLEKLPVSNFNTNLNQDIEDAMEAGDLLTVTGRNAAGYVIAAKTVMALATDDGNDVAIANCGGTERAVMSDSSTINPLVAGAAGNSTATYFSENDGVLNFIDGGGTSGRDNQKALTLAKGCTIQLVNLGTGAVKDISLGVAAVYINNEGGKLQKCCDFTFELDQYGYVCSLYVIEK